MGVIKEFKCPACKKTWKIFTGHGRAHSTVKRVLGVFSPDTRKQILEDAQGEADPLFLFNYREAICPDCQDITAVPVFQFLETHQSYVSCCPKCGGTAELPDDPCAVTCPRCHEAELTVREIGHWD